MAGYLTINSSGDGTLLSGHSWIEYTPDGGQPTTYGTWGNNPEGLGNGLHQDLELGRTGDATRTIYINGEQEKELYKKIQEYKDKGGGGWDYLHPCSSFAADVWQAVTGQTLADRSFGIISNPSKLKESILQKDKEQPSQPGTSSDSARSRPPSSRLPVNHSSVQPC